MTIVNMQLCKSPSEINKAIMSNKEGWEGLYTAEQIISIAYISNKGSFIVFWREELLEDDE